MLWEIHWSYPTLNTALHVEPITPSVPHPLDTKMLPLKTFTPSIEMIGWFLMELSTTRRRRKIPQAHNAVHTKVKAPTSSRTCVTA